MKRILIPLIIFSLIIGCAKKTPEDCVLENIDKAHSNLSANLIGRVCEEKYGVKKVVPKVVEDSRPAAPAADVEFIDPYEKKDQGKGEYIHDPYDK